MDRLSILDQMELWNMCWPSADDISKKHYFDTAVKELAETMRENERLQREVAARGKVIDDFKKHLERSNKHTSHGCPRCNGAVCSCNGFKPTYGDKPSQNSLPRYPYCCKGDPNCIDQNCGCTDTPENRRRFEQRAKTSGEK